VLAWLGNAAVMLADRSEIVVVRQSVYGLQNLSIHFVDPVDCWGLWLCLAVKHSACTCHHRIVGNGATWVSEKPSSLTVGIVVVVVVVSLLLL